MVRRSIENILKQYVESACEHGVATESGEFEKANKNYKKNEKAFKKLLEFGKEGCEELTNLLNHQNPYVKLSAATHLLSTKNKESISILKKISKESGIVGFNAKMVLKEWKKGNLEIQKFDSLLKF
jgi:HEAT repeat protein